MTHKFITTFILGALCIGAFMVGSLNIAQANKSDVGKVGAHHSPNVTVMLGKAEMINIGGEIADVLVADPSIVDVMAVKSNRLYVVGSNLGDTNIMALNAEGDIIKKINIHVQMDTERLSSMVNELYPSEQVNIKALTDQVVLTGNVSNPETANKIVNLVARYAADAQGVTGGAVDNIVVNMMGVRGEQQVMLRVKIVEASRSALKDLGLELNATGGSFGDAAIGIATATALGLTNPTQLAAGVLSYNSGDLGNVSYLARALEQEGILNTLAEPNLTSISGEQAGFLAGGEFPIPTQLDDNGNLVYEFRPFGVSLNFLPTVMSEDRISLQLTTEVSTATFDRNLQLQGISVPTFNVRRAETTVELPSGGTLMIAGLLQSESISGLSQLPGVGDIPVVGDLVKSDTFTRDESEVVVMITPYLVKPFAQNRSAQAPSPTPVLESAPFMQDSKEPMPIGSYGAIQPVDVVSSEDLGVPRSPFAPERQENQTSEFFADNLRRVYGEKNFNKLPLDSKDLGYVLD
jgi:pilus assembly protein CpaC